MRIPIAAIYNSTLPQLRDVSAHTPEAALQREQTTVAQSTRQPVASITKENVLQLNDQRFGENANNGNDSAPDGKSGQTSQSHQNVQHAASSQPLNDSQSAAKPGYSSPDFGSISSQFSPQFHENSGAQEVSGNRSEFGTKQSLVYDETDIMRQIVDKFTLQTRQQSSRIAMQLHPAELGEIKIEVMVKGDVLKATIIAGSSGAGEIIDRNLYRLREMLEAHGLQIDDLNVYSEDSELADFSFQQDHLFHEQNDQPNEKNRSNKISFETAIEDASPSQNGNQEGVNLTV